VGWRRRIRGDGGHRRYHTGIAINRGLRHDGRIAKPIADRGQRTLWIPSPLEQVVDDAPVFLDSADSAAGAAGAFPATYGGKRCVCRRRRARA
jgi:hypothetical protein